MLFPSAHTCQGRAGSWVNLLDSILGQKLYCCSTCKIAAARHVPPPLPDVLHFVAAAVANHLLQFSHSAAKHKLAQ